MVKKIVAKTGKILTLTQKNELKCLSGLEIKAGFDDFSFAISKRNLGQNDIIYLIEENLEGNLEYYCQPYTVLGPFGSSCKLSSNGKEYFPSDLLDKEITWLM